MVKEAAEESSKAISFHPPWMARLYRAERYKAARPPATIDELNALARPKGVDPAIAQILQYSAQCVRSNWRRNWNRLLAVGPFEKTPRPRETLQYILYGDIRSFSSNLEFISKALADPYAEFKVLPDVFIFHDQFIETLQKIENRNWLLTQHFSIEINGKNI